MADPDMTNPRQEGRLRGNSLLPKSWPSVHCAKDLTLPVALCPMTTAPGNAELQVSLLSELRYLGPRAEPEHLYSYLMLFPFSRSGQGAVHVEALLCVDA